MKKLLTVSLFAVMAVSAAHADIASTQYVDGQIDAGINALDVTDNRVNGQYVAAVSETDGSVSNVKVAFDTEVNKDSTAYNAPTSQAVYNAINPIKTVVDAEPWKSNVIDSTQIADNAVTTAKIRDGEVKTADIADLNVTTAKIANDAVTAAKIADDVKSTATTGAGVGSYSHSVTQAKGLVSVVNTSFDTVINKDSTDKNAPTSAAVKSYVDGELSAVTTAATNLEARVTALDSEAEASKGRVTLLEEDVDSLIEQNDTLTDTKQDKSNVAYALGTGAGNWIDLMSTLPAKCKDENAVCTMVAKGGKMHWEFIQGGTTTEGEIPSEPVKEAN